jgi:hypothetical protein
MIRIHGSSDDLVEIDGSVRDEINVIDRPAVITITDAIGQGCRVIAEYAPSHAPVWRLAVEQLDEDGVLPWPVRIVPLHAYSLQVEIDCPDTVTVEWTPKAEA